MLNAMNFPLLVGQRGHEYQRTTLAFHSESEEEGTVLHKLSLRNSLVHTHSPADKCKIWQNCAFHEKSVKFGTKLEHILTNVFSFKTIADLSRDPSCVHVLNGVIKSVFFPFVRCFSQRTDKTQQQSCHIHRLNCMSFQKCEEMKCLVAMANSSLNKLYVSVVYT